MIALRAVISIICRLMSEWKSQLAEAVDAGKILATTKENVERLLAGTSNPVAEGAVQELVEAGEWDELNDRFFKTLEFGTGGLRGRTIGKVVTQRQNQQQINRTYLTINHHGHRFISMTVFYCLS